MFVADAGCGRMGGCGDGVGADDDEAWSRTLSTSRGLPMTMPTAPEMYPPQKSADMAPCFGLGLIRPSSDGDKVVEPHEERDTGCYSHAATRQMDEQFDRLRDRLLLPIGY